MKLEEAITRSAVIAELMATDFSQADADAVKLGIEALRRIQFNRSSGTDNWWQELPGETKD